MVYIEHSFDIELQTTKYLYKYRSFWPTRCMQPYKTGFHNGRLENLEFDIFNIFKIYKRLYMYIK
jgi:hypothetical protein